MVSAPNKLLTLFRWMGCTVAVYDCMVRAKADRRVERSRAKRGTKRRGSRSGNRNARKRRRLVTADPDSHNPTSTEARCYRANYLESRQVSYVARSCWTVVKVWKAAERISPVHGDVVKRRALYDRVKVKLRDLVDTVSRISGSPVLMARIRVYRAVQEMGGPVRKIRWGNHWVRPDDALETYEDFLSVRYPPEPDLTPPEGASGKKPLTINLLEWLVTTQRSMAPPSQRRVKKRA